MYTALANARLKGLGHEERMTSSGAYGIFPHWRINDEFYMPSSKGQFEHLHEIDMEYMDSNFFIVSLKAEDLFSIVFKIFVPQKTQGLCNHSRSCKTGAQVVFFT